MRQNMWFKKLCDLGMFVVVYGARGPTDDEWLDYLTWVEREGIATTPQLVVSDGGAPTLFQLRYLAGLLGGQSARVAVVSDNPHVRRVVRRIAGFNPAIKVFSPPGFPDVFEHLQLKLDSRQSADVVEVVVELRVALGAA